MFKRSVYATSIMVVLTFGLALCSFTASAAKHPQLPPTYDHWLNQEVNYLITNQERESFLALTTNQDRDAFIDTFWAIRNPDPNSPGNTYKDEHYRRLEYVNNHYGSPSAGNGWHTDRGMVYITLGPPQQKRSYLNTKYLEPLETWFYQDPASALAPYFSVLFFKPSPAEDFRIYSPYQDRPDKLIASTNGANDVPTALRIIKADLETRLPTSPFLSSPTNQWTTRPALQRWNRMYC